MCKFECATCHKQYSSIQSLCNHTTHKHGITTRNKVSKCSPNVDMKMLTCQPNNHEETKTEIPSKNTSEYNFKCEFCAKCYKSRQSKSRHQKSCINKPNVENMQQKINDLQNITTELQSQIEELKKTPQTTIHNGHINNGTITNNNITIKYGSEDLSQILSQEDMIKICNKKFSSIEQSIEMVHLNKNRPELHNVIINNLNNNFAHIYDGDKYIVKEKNEIIEDLIELHLDNIEMIISETNDNNIRGKLDQNTIKKLEELRERLDDEEKFKINNKTYDNYRSYKINQIKLLIYNCIKNLKIIMNK